MKIKIQKAFDRASETYIKAHTAQEQAAETLISLMIEKKWPIFENGTVLDLGCGPGGLSQKLCNLGFGLKDPGGFFLNDLSAEMLRKAQQTLGSRVLKTFLGDMESISGLPVCDLVTSNFAFQWSENLHEMIIKSVSLAPYCCFTTLLHGTFESWDLLCQRYGHHQVGRTYPKEEYLSSLSVLGKNHSFYTKKFSLEFSCLEDFFRYMKNLGCGISSHPPPLKTLIQMCKEYKKESFTINYHVGFSFYEPI